MTIEELLTDPGRWTTNAEARDDSGNLVAVLSDRAVCWCLSGALQRCYRFQAQGLVDALGRLCQVLVEDMPGCQTFFPHEQIQLLIEFNDTPGRQFAEVRRIIEKAQV